METSASFEARSAPSSYPTIVCRRDADAVSLAEGSIQMTDNARLFGVAGVPSPGHAFKWIPREPRRAPYLSRTGPWFSSTRYPLEGRGEQVDVSARCHIHETQNSGMYVQRRHVDQPSRFNGAGSCT